MKDCKGKTIFIDAYIKTAPGAYLYQYFGIIKDFVESHATNNLLVHCYINSLNYYFRHHDVICITKDEYFLSRLES